MGDDEERGIGETLSLYGLALGFIALYLVAFAGGLYAVVLGTGWLDARVVQPAVGGSDLVSAALLAAAIFGYLLVVYRLATTGAVVGIARSDAQAAEGSDYGWGRF